MGRKPTFKKIYEKKFKTKELIKFIENEEHNFFVKKRIHTHRHCNTFFGEIQNFYFSNKKIRKNKILKIFKNNINPEKKLTLNIFEKAIKWYKGDYFYFKGNYDARGMRRMTKYKIIIK